jgi:hypothetical protein
MNLDVDHVIAVLAERFDWDDSTKSACRTYLARREWDGGFAPWFEFICDEPVVSNWRLKSDSSSPWALRMSYYGRNPERQAEADEITVVLAAGRRT